MKKDMGGLRKYMPITFWTFIIGTLALLGFFPLAGFWSKDEIIANAGHNGYTAFMVIGLIGAFLTAAYMTRCVWLTFFGEYRGGHHEPDVGEFGYEPVGEDIDAEVAQLAARGGHATAVAVASGGHDAHDAHGPVGDVGAHDAGAHGAHDDHHAEPHESPLILTVPLMILAVLSITVGWLNMPWEVLKFEKFLEWVAAHGGVPRARARALQRRPRGALRRPGRARGGCGGLALPAQLRHVPRPDGAQPAGRAPATPSSSTSTTSTTSTRRSSSTASAAPSPGPPTGSTRR